MDAGEILAAREHRAFPLPEAPWVMRQEWHDLMFAHWSVPVAGMRDLVPPKLELDLWQGQAYLAVTPFVLRGMRPRGLPAVPGLSDFPELNVRTYVKHRGIGGVFFFSLDAANFSAVLGARAGYRLPYFYAEMKASRSGEKIDYSSRRKDVAQPPTFSARYAPSGPELAWQPPQSSLERFLTERYCLFTARRGRVFKTDIHHLPWPLQPAQANIRQNTMAQGLGISLEREPELLHFSRALEVLVWWPQRME